MRMLVSGWARIVREAKLAFGPLDLINSCFETYSTRFCTIP